MQNRRDVEAADRAFFEALTKSDLPALEHLLVDDFVLVDVMSGGEIGKSALLDVISSGRLKFESIQSADTRVRCYGSTGVVNGRTRMQMRFEDAPAVVGSRYTHVFIQENGRWRMVSAQGTQIAG